MSRSLRDDIQIFKDHRSFLAKVDIGAFAAQGYLNSDGAISLLAGDPLLVLPNATTWRRDRDLLQIHGQGLTGNWDSLRQAEGAFCLAHYQPKLGKLTLISDKLGIRPLYYWMDQNLVVFSTALRILEGVALVPKRMDIRAVTEILALGIPLSDRTPYASVSLMKPAEIVEITEQDSYHKCYWKWDEIKTSNRSEEESHRDVYETFQAAVARRLKGDQSTIAYLSGGLDSRCVVAALANLGARVHTFNFARPGTQDLIFGENFARRIGTVHQNVPKEPGDITPDYSAIMAKAWGEARNHNAPVERPHLVWSGEGGSVLLGHVHVSESIVKLMRSSNLDGAIEEYFTREHIIVPAKLFKRHIYSVIENIVRDGVREQVAAFHCEDPARNFYLFLMLNEQRRKLTSHFENIDKYRLELQLPFFDSSFLASIISSRIDWFSRHKFYVKWLKHFQAEVTEVPWQAYPGHQPCPLPMPKELSYQWDEKYRRQEDADRRVFLANQGAALLKARDFPREILNKLNLRIATSIYSRGWRNYDYLIESARTFHLYWQRCNGQFVLPSSR